MSAVLLVYTVLICSLVVPAFWSLLLHVDVTLPSTTTAPSLHPPTTASTQSRQVVAHAVTPSLEDGYSEEDCSEP